MKTRKSEKRKLKQVNQEGNKNKTNIKEIETRKPERSLNKIIKLNKRHNKSFKQDYQLV